MVWTTLSHFRLWFIVILFLRNTLDVLYCTVLQKQMLLSTTIKPALYFALFRSFCVEQKKSFFKLLLFKLDEKIFSKKLSKVIISLSLFLFWLMAIFTKHQIKLLVLPICFISTLMNLLPFVLLLVFDFYYWVKFV